MHDKSYDMHATTTLIPNEDIGKKIEVEVPSARMQILIDSPNHVVSSKKNSILLPHAQQGTTFSRQSIRSKNAKLQPILSPFAA